MTETEPETEEACRAGRSSWFRTNLVFCLFALWFLVIIGRLLQVMVIERESYLPATRESRQIRGTIPPLRGRILDRDGTPLAVSSRFLELRWHVPEHEREIRKKWPRIKFNISALSDWKLQDVLGCAGRPITLVPHVKPAQVPEMREATNMVDGLQFHSRFVRRYYPDPAVRRRLGTVKNRHGIVVGASGAEAKHDTLLRGCPGVYRVAVDDNGKWMPESWEKIRELRTGYDVYLPLAVEPRKLVRRQR